MNHTPIAAKHGSTSAISRDGLKQRPLMTDCRRIANACAVLASALLGAAVLPAPLSTCFADDVFEMSYYFTDTEAGNTGNNTSPGWPTAGTVWSRGGTCIAEVTDTKARVYFQQVLLDAHAHDQSSEWSLTQTNVNFSGYAYGEWDWMGAPGESPVVAVVTKLDGETGTTGGVDYWSKFNGSARTATGSAVAISWVEFEGTFYADQDVSPYWIEDDGYYVKSGAQASATSTSTSASEIYVEDDSAWWMLENEAQTGEPTHSVNLSESSGQAGYNSGVFRFAVEDGAGDTDYTQEGASTLTFIAELNMTVYVRAHVVSPGDSEADAYIRGGVKELESYVELVQD